MLDLISKEILKNSKNHFISEGIPKEPQLSEVINTLHLILELSNITRRQGLLTLEDKLAKIPSGIKGYQILKLAISLIVDGTDPEFVSKILRNKLIVYGLDSFEAFNGYLISYGALCIQWGENPRLIEEELFACLPDEILEIVKETLHKKQNELTDEYIEDLYQDWLNRPIKKTNTVLLKIFSKKFIKYKDKEIQIILKEMDSESIAILAYYADKELKNAITKNLSKRKIAYLMDEFYYLEESRLPEIIENFMKVIYRLEYSGDIICYKE